MHARACMLSPRRYSPCPLTMYDALTKRAAHPWVRMVPLTRVHTLVRMTVAADAGWSGSGSGSGSSTWPCAAVGGLRHLFRHAFTRVGVGGVAAAPDDTLRKFRHELAGIEAARQKAQDARDAAEAEVEELKANSELSSCEKERVLSRTMLKVKSLTRTIAALTRQVGRLEEYRAVIHGALLA